jgi:hypothetical protein
VQRAGGAAAGNFAPARDGVPPNHVGSECPERGIRSVHRRGKSVHHGVEVVYAIPDIKDNLDNHEVALGGQPPPCMLTEKHPIV